MKRSDLIMDFTGERFVPECVREILYEHWHRYAWVRQLTRNQIVLDVACGEGYGSYFLSKTAHSVVGVDIDEPAIGHAKERYKSDNLRFAVADALSLPFDDSTIDVVVCFETLEHLEDHQGLLDEFKRVLKPSGWLALSSPEKASYSDQADYSNPFHVKELYREELETLLANNFTSYQLWAQKLTFASAVWSLNGTQRSIDTSITHWLTMTDAEIHSAPSPQYQPQYILAIASMSGNQSGMPSLSLFSDIEESVYQHYNAEIRHHMQSAALLAERDQIILDLSSQLAQPWWRLLLKRFFG